MSDRTRLDVAALVRELEARREAKGISWRDLAREAGVSASTLTRMRQHSKLPDVNSFSALVAWLQVPAEMFMKSDQGKADPDPIAIASALLRGNKELSPKGEKALRELLNAAIKFAKEVE